MHAAGISRLEKSLEPQEPECGPRAKQIESRHEPTNSVFHRRMRARRRARRAERARRVRHSARRRPARSGARSAPAVYRSRRAGCVHRARAPAFGSGALSRRASHRPAAAARPARVRAAAAVWSALREIRPEPPRPTPTWRGALAARRAQRKWAKPARRIRSRSRSRAIACCARTAAWAATAGASAQACAAPARDGQLRAAHDWDRVGGELDAQGCAVIERLFRRRTSAARSRRCTRDDAHFRSRVVMARHGFGRGEYKYFGYPLPPLVAELRAALYPPLCRIANRWNARARASTSAIPASTRLPRALSRGGPDAGRRRCSCNTARATTTACTRTCTASMFPAAGRDPSLGARARLHAAANSCSPSSARACSRAPKSCRCGRATR